MRSGGNLASLTLDVGCGKDKQCKIGVDYDRNSDADIIADALHLPFKEDVFRVVLSSYVIEHSLNAFMFLQEQNRILKKDGLLYCFTDNPEYYGWSVLGLKGQKHQFLEHDHFAIFYPENIIRMLKILGLNVIYLHYIRIKRMIDCIVRIVIFFRIFRKEALFKRYMVVAKK